MEYTMSKITINETVFDGESVLRAVRQITPLPCVGMGGAWYGRQNTHGNAQTAKNWAVTLSARPRAGAMWRRVDNGN